MSCSINQRPYSIINSARDGHKPFTCEILCRHFSDNIVSESQNRFQVRYVLIERQTERLLDDKVSRD